jgi:regulator of replication initiation timing
VTLTQGMVKIHTEISEIKNSIKQTQEKNRKIWITKKLREILIGEKPNV